MVQGGQKLRRESGIGGFKAAANHGKSGHRPDFPLIPLKRVLFVCSQNRLRSPTAEQVYAEYPGVECASAGTNHNAENPLTAELVEWADIIFAMERTHRNKLQSRFRKQLNDKRVIVLDISDDYDYMDPDLVRLLKVKVSRHLPS